ncbi:MAG: FAD:protein FMN transferase [Desulfobacter sp.]|nr:MAG: FAD:protein FMN transferase [Desulfobacter sp.]
MRRIHLFSVILLATLLVATVFTASAREYVFTGKTMGTFYRIKFISNQPVSLPLWKKKVNIRLREVNTQLSMFQKNSEISRFNAGPPHTPFKLSTDFSRVLEQCRRLHALSGGAWDGTVKPLVDLWGFGVRDKAPALPAPREIKAALARTGFDKLVLKGRTLTKTEAGLTLDLGSIAKGYGVDEIARLFPDAGITDYLIEIGGELAGGGRNIKGKPWSVGISRPVKGTVNSGLYRVVTLDNMAIATSGNYRNFFEINGKTYSHIIHPDTGYPVDNRVVSASVIAKNCTIADGLATALMVMDTDSAIDLVNGLADIECLIIKNDGSSLIPVRSKGFKAFEMD